MSDRVALVTGASRGIGRAIALRLAEDGYCVAVNYRRLADEAKATVEAIEGRGGEALAVQADVSHAADVSAMFSHVQDALGPITALVNNAGIRRDGLSLRMSDTAWRDVIETNLSGTFFCSRRALRDMVRARHGRIVNVASVAGLRASPGQANYCAAKAGVIGMTRAMAAEVARTGVTINAVAPGLIDTELTRSLPPERFEEITSAVPAARAGTAEEVAGMVAFLCRAEAAYVTGTVLTIDGGMSA